MFALNEHTDVYFAPADHILSPINNTKLVFLCEESNIRITLFEGCNKNVR